MTLTYITRTVVPSRAAQSVQIISMSKAFHHIMGERFCLISGRGEACDTFQCGFRWDRQSVPTNPLLRHLKFCAIALKRIYSERDTIVFTRDIAVAFAVVGAGVRAVFEAHKAPAGQIAAGMTRWLVTSPRFLVVAITRSLADYYVDQYRLPPKRVLVAHDGVFAEDYCPLNELDKAKVRAELGLPIDKLLVVHTGSLYKGGGDLFVHLAAAGGDEVEVIQLGGTEDERVRWASHYAALGYTNIRFIPHQPAAVVRLYQLSADLLFYMNTRSSPIYWCTSPLKLFEYMATGVPILGAAIGSVSEVISESNAFCYDPDQPSSLTDAWRRFTADPAGAQRRAANAREEAETLYSWYRRAGRIVDFAQAGDGVSS